MAVLCVNRMATQPLYWPVSMVTRRWWRPYWLLGLMASSVKRVRRMEVDDTAEAAVHECLQDLGGAWGMDGSKDQEGGCNKVIQHSCCSLEAMGCSQFCAFLIKMFDCQFIDDNEARRSTASDD